MTPRLLDVTPQPDVDHARHPPELREAMEHAHGTEDAVYEAEHPPAEARKVRADELARFRESYWLPEGHHYDLHIEHAPLESSGDYTGGGNKWCWHITVSPWNTVDSMWRVLRDKRAAPQLIIGGRAGVAHPVVIQCMPLNRAGRALAHPSGPDTNRADCIQVEICATVADVPHFDENHRYRALANLVRLVNITVPNEREVPREVARDFTDARRFGGQQFVDTKGHHGHMHVPGNDHGDPTSAFRGGVLMRRLNDMPAGGHRL